MRLICPTSATGTACMTQNTGRSLPELKRNVNGILRVYFETLSGYCGPPEIWIENRRWAPWTEKFGREVARLAP